MRNTLVCSLLLLLGQRSSSDSHSHNYNSFHSHPVQQQQQQHSGLETTSHSDRLSISSLLNHSSSNKNGSLSDGPLVFPVFRAPSTSLLTPSERRQLLSKRASLRRVLVDAPPPAVGSSDQRDLFMDVDLFGQFNSLGYYYTYLHIGEPEQFFTVIMDTGSVVTAVPCEGCKDCGKHSGGRAVPNGHGTETGIFSIKKSKTAVNTGAKFVQSYTEGSKLSGVYVEDNLCLGQDCNLDTEGVRFKFGCANVMTNLFRTQLADGIMGMANHGNTVLNFLRKGFHKDMYTLCLSRTNGYYTIGGYETVRHYTPIIWNPNYQAQQNKYYHVQVTGINVNGLDSGVKKESLKYSYGGALVDSGTTYSYIPRTAHAQMTSAFTKFCSADDNRCKGTKTSYDKTSVACYHALKPSEKATFPDIQFVTAGGTMCIPPSQYFFEERGHSCVGFLRDTSSFVIGGNFMMNYDVIFDREKGRVGFARASCEGADIPPTCCGTECARTAGDVSDAIDEVAKHLGSSQRSARSASSGSAAGGEPSNELEGAAEEAVAALLMEVQ